MEGNVIVIFCYKNKQVDVEIPLNISANELIYALNSGFELGMDIRNPKNCFLRSENPIRLLRGEKTLDDFGIRNGTTIFFD